MSLRNSMMIIVNPNIKMFHFCDQRLAGICNEAWYPFAENALFQYVEKYLVSSGLAQNVVSVDNVRQCGDCVDYQVTFNESLPAERKGKYNHAFDIAFEVVTDNEGKNVKGAELRAGLVRRLLITPDDELEEACGLPHDSFENN